MFRMAASTFALLLLLTFVRIRAFGWTQQIDDDPASPHRLARHQPKHKVEANLIPASSIQSAQLGPPPALLSRNTTDTLGPLTQREPLRNQSCTRPEPHRTRPITIRHTACPRPIAGKWKMSEGEQRRAKSNSKRLSRVQTTRTIKCHRASRNSPCGARHASCLICYAFIFEPPSTLVVYICSPLRQRGSSYHHRGKRLKRNYNDQTLRTLLPYAGIFHPVFIRRR